MKIKAIEMFPIVEPRKGFSYSLLKIQGEDGLYGWGECPRISPAALDLARTNCVGQEPTRYDYLTNQLSTYPETAAAVNMALLDLCGKMAKAPVFQLLGGPTRNKVRAMTAAGPQGTMDRLRADGHRAFVVPVNLPAKITSRPQTVSALVRQFEDLRQSLGDSVDFVADGQGLLPSAEAADFAVALEGLHPLWLDQPCKAPSEDVLRRLTEESVTPIGLGRDFDSPGPIQNLLRDGLVDIVRLPLTRLGITPWRRAAAIAETYYVAVAPYLTHGGPISTAAALHLAASVPNFYIQQIPLVLDAETRKLRDELVGGSLERVTGGFLSLSDKPGLGVEVNETVVRRMAQ